MARIKRGFKARKRRNRVLKATKGYTLGRRNKFKRAVETWRRAMRYAFRDRKAKKRDFRALWNTRISAACELNGTSYSRLIHSLSEAKVLLNRKMLADVAAHDPMAFTAIVKQVSKSA